MSDKNFKVKNGIDANGAVTITQPSTSTVPLTILANTLAAGSNLLEVKRPDGTVRFAVGNDGALTVNSNISFNGGSMSMYPGNSGQTALSVFGQTNQSVANLIVRAATGQSGNVQEWRDQNNNVAARIGPDFAFRSISGGFFGTATGNIVGSNYLAVRGWAEGHIPFVVQGFASQTGDLTRWVDSSANTLAKVDASGSITAVDLTLSGNLTVNGTTTNLNSTNLIIEDKNIIIADVATPTDTTADGAGITIKGATDKTLNWVQSTGYFTSSEPFIINTTSTTRPSLIVKSIASQTSAVQEWQNSSGSSLANIDSSGYFRGPLVEARPTNPGLYGVAIAANASQSGDLFQITDASNNAYTGVSATGKLVTGNTTNASRFTQLTSAALGQLTVYSSTASTIGAVIRSAASQTANLTEWQDASGTVLSSINASGNLILGNQYISFNAASAFARFTLLDGFTNQTILYPASAGFLVQNLGVTGMVVLKVKGVASQTANLQEWQNSSGTALANVTSSGSFFAQSLSSSATGYQGNIASNDGTKGNLNFNTSGYGLLVTSAQASAIVLTARAAASQTGDLQQWQNSSGTVLTKVDANGVITITNTSAAGAIFQANGAGGGYFSVGPYGGISTNGGLSSIGGSSSFGGYGGASNVVVTVKGASGQTGDLQQWTNFAGTTLANVDSSGNITDASNTAWLSPIGSGSNDAVAIQALIDAGKKEIRLGSGQWTFSTRIKVPNGVTIRGTGTSRSSTTGTRVNAVALIASEGTIRDIMFTGAGENTQSELGGGGIAVLGGRVIDCSVTDSRWVLAPTRQPHGYLKNFMSKMQSGYGSVKVAVLGDSLSENTSTTSWYGYLFNTATTATGYYLGSYFGHQIAPSEVDNMAIGGQGAYLLSAQLAMTKETLRTGDYVNQVLDGDRVSTSPFFNRDYNLAILAIGQNGGEDWKAHLEYTVKTIRDKGIDVIILTQNPAASNPTSRAGDEYFYRSMAETYGCLLVDTQAYFRLEVEFGRALGTTADLFGDSIHQSALGHQLYAKAILNALLDYDSTVAVPANKTVVSRSYLPAQTDRAAAIAGLNSYYLVKRPDSLRGISGVTYTTATDTSIRNPIYGRGTTTNSVATIASGGYATWGIEHATAAYIIYRENATANTLTVAIQAGGSTLATLTTGVTNGRTSVQKVMLAGGYPANRAIRITNTSGDPVQIYGVVFETHADVAFNRNTDGSYAGVKLNGSWAYSDFLSMASYSGYLTPHTSTTNNSVEFKFYGDGLRFATSYGKNSGIIQVKIDDTTYTAVDTYNNINEYGVYTHFYGGLEYGLHTATITLTGANASVTGLTSDGARFGLHRISAVRSEWYLTQDQQFAPNSDTSSIVNSVSSIRMGSVGGANIATFYNGTNGYGAGSIASTGTFNINAANVGFPYTSSGATLNVNAGASTIVPLTARGVTSQTANLQEWQNTSGTVLAAISSSGVLKIQNIIDQNNSGATFQFSSTSINAYTFNPATTPFTVNGAASQTADLQQWKNSAGTVLTRIGSDGAIYRGAATIDSYGAIYTTETMAIGANAGQRFATGGLTIINRENASAVILGIKGLASQSGDLTQWRNSSDVVIANVAADGAGTFKALTLTSGNGTFTSPGWSGFGTFGPSGGTSGVTLGISPYIATNTALVVKGFASQTANLQEWQNSAGTVLAKVDKDGNFTATSKSFDIEHPTKENMRLRYGSLEGPENGVYVRGTVESNVIELPDYWTELVHKDSITASLTSVGSAQNIYVEKIENNKIYIGGNLEKAFFTVYGERKDIDKLTVEY